MAKETTLNEVGSMLKHIVKHMATKEDLAELRTELKTDIATLQTQTNSIETEIRGMRHGKLEVRVSDLEEEVFGEIRN